MDVDEQCVVPSRPIRVYPEIPITGGRPVNGVVELNRFVWRQSSGSGWLRGLIRHPFVQELQVVRACQVGNRNHGSITESTSHSFHRSQSKPQPEHAIP